MANNYSFSRKLKNGTPRIDWIDMAKGIAIFLVVLGHVPNLPNFFGLYIYTFHIPLFFFLSGYLFNPAKNNSLLQLIRQRASRLIVPYFFYSTLSLGFYFAVNWRILMVGNGFVSQLRDFIIGLIYAVRGTQWTFHSGALWFIACLFVVEIFFFLIYKLAKGDRMALSYLLVASSVIGYLYAKLYNVPLPWSIDAAFTGVVFYGIGFMVKDLGVVEKLRPGILPLACFFIVSFFAGNTNRPADMFSGSYGNYFLFYVSALAGIAMVITFVRLIKKWLILVFLGRNSLEIMGLHYYIGIAAIDFLLGRYFSGNLFYAINYSSRIVILRDLLGLLGLSVVYAIAVIIVILPLMLLINVARKHSWFSRNSLAAVTTAEIA